MEGVGPARPLPMLQPCNNTNNIQVFIYHFKRGMRDGNHMNSKSLNFT